MMSESAEPSRSWNIVIYLQPSVNTGQQYVSMFYVKSTDSTDHFSSEIFQVNKILHFDWFLFFDFSSKIKKINLKNHLTQNFSLIWFHEIPALVIMTTQYLKMFKLTHKDFVYKDYLRYITSCNETDFVNLIIYSFQKEKNQNM